MIIFTQSADSTLSLDKHFLPHERELKQYFFNLIILRLNKYIHNVTIYLFVSKSNLVVTYIKISVEGAQLENVCKS